MKTELTEEEINELLVYAGKRPELYNKIMNVAYKRWGIILPPVNVMVTMQILEEICFETCEYYDEVNSECFAQKGRPRVDCLGIKEGCKKEGGCKK